MHFILHALAEVIMPQLCRQKVSLLLVCGSLASFSFAAEPPRRIPPPHWTQDVLDAFFEDARKQLVGDRPREAANSVVEQSQQTTGNHQPVSPASKWSVLVGADTLTAEIKRLNIQLASALKKSAGYLGGGNLTCQRDFSFCAVLFGVLAEFDPNDSNLNRRWQQSAALIGQRCFETSENCQTASAQSYKIAKEARTLLEELIRGQAPTGTADKVIKQSLVSRPQLMQSMELIQQERLSTAMASAREFRKRSQLAAEQGQLLAVLATVIQQQGYEYTDDDTYLEEARQLRQAASELAKAAQEKNYEAARAAAGKVSQACNRCHEDYRG